MCGLVDRPMWLDLCKSVLRLVDRQTLRSDECDLEDGPRLVD